MIRVVVASLLLATASYSAMAQVISTPPNFEASGNTDILRHRGPTGSPCLTVSGYARHHTIDRNLYDHMILVTNSCAQRIKLRVCYYMTDDCILMEVPGDEHQEAILGTLPSMKDFRFDFKEQF
jgi:hypothetical protein